MSACVAFLKWLIELMPQAVLCGFEVVLLVVPVALGDTEKSHEISG